MREILVIRQKDVFSRILIDSGFSVTNFPTIKTETLADLSELETYLAEIERFDGIFITSSKAAEIFAAKLAETEKVFAGKFYVLGKRSRDLLNKPDCEVFFSENATTAEKLLDAIPKEELKNKRFLFPRGDLSLRTVPETLQNVAEVVETVVYRTIETDASVEKIVEIKEKFERDEISAVCFFSPSGVESFLRKFENFSQSEIKIAVIGKTTARFIKEKNLRVDFVSAKTSATDFAAEFTSYLRKES